MEVTHYEEKREIAKRRRSDKDEESDYESGDSIDNIDDTLSIGENDDCLSSAITSECDKCGKIYDWDGYLTVEGFSHCFACKDWDGDTYIQHCLECMLALSHCEKCGVNYCGLFGCRETHICDLSLTETVKQLATMGITKLCNDCEKNCPNCHCQECQCENDWPSID